MQVGPFSQYRTVAGVPAPQQLVKPTKYMGHPRIVLGTEKEEDGQTESTK